MEVCGPFLLSLGAENKKKTKFQDCNCLGLLLETLLMIRLLTERPVESVYLCLFNFVRVEERDSS